MQKRNETLFSFQNARRIHVDLQKRREAFFSFYIARERVHLRKRDLTSFQYNVRETYVKSEEKKDKKSK